LTGQGNREKASGPDNPYPAGFSSAYQIRIWISFGITFRIEKFYDLHHLMEHKLPIPDINDQIDRHVSPPLSKLILWMIMIFY
jgi:hypothetical protein